MYKWAIRLEKSCRASSPSATAADCMVGVRDRVNGLSVLPDGFGMPIVGVRDKVKGLSASGVGLGIVCKVDVRDNGIGLSVMEFAGDPCEA